MLYAVDERHMSREQHYGFKMGSGILLGRYALSFIFPLGLSALSFIGDDEK